MDAIECKCFFLLLNERRNETPLSLSLSLPNTRERACQPAFYLSSTELKQGEDQLFSQTWVLLFNYLNRAIYSCMECLNISCYRFLAAKSICHKAINKLVNPSKRVINNTTVANELPV